ncbi:MAG: ATP-binding protein [Caldilineales bacterium]
MVEITETAQRISAEDMSKRLNLDLPDDEIGRLASTFDAMLARLEAAFRREQQLTADVSHELRTPLGLLKAQLSLARTKPRDAETLVSMMVAMEGDVDRLTHIVEQTLLLSQVEQQGIAEPEPLFLDDVLLAALERLRPIAQARGVESRLEITPQIDWQTSGDTQLLEQAFANLLQNAITHTPAGGVVTLSAQRLWHGFTVRVADTGPGISPEHLPHLFERYYRVDDSRTRETGGFGLGLTITDSIVRAHGGAISVDSTTGAGTTFIVTLPAAPH